MKKIFLVAFSATFFLISVAQLQGKGDKPQTVKPKESGYKNVTTDAQNKTAPTYFTIEKSIAATSVKNQGMTGTCWCFSTTSLIESQALKNNVGNIDLSEMFTVRNTYLEKAKNYVLRQGHAQFGEGGLGHDLINTIAKYGAMPESVYSGLDSGDTEHNHVKLVKELKEYLDSVIKMKPVPENWMEEFEEKMNEDIGDPPAEFAYKGKKYTPKTFADDVLKFNANDYVNITSFTHHNYYEPFVLEVPDNFSNGAFYNVPLNEMIDLTKDALAKGYSVLWDADVSNSGFQQKLGSAVDMDNLPKGLKTKQDIVDGEIKEGKPEAERRQKLFENLTTQDDHLMHIIGVEKSKSGNVFFLVKNSWGDIGPYHGYINVSEAYFGINTVSLVVPKAALSKSLLEKLKLK